MSLRPYVFIAYEREDLPNSTGQVVCMADTQAELAKRTHISLSYIEQELRRQRENKKRTGHRKYDLSNRMPYDIRKVYLN